MKVSIHLRYNNYSCNHDYVQQLLDLGPSEAGNPDDLQEEKEGKLDETISTMELYTDMNFIGDDDDDHEYIISQVRKN